MDSVKSRLFVIVMVGAFFAGSLPLFASSDRAGKRVRATVQFQGCTDARNGVGTLRTTTTRVTLSPGPLSVFDGNGSAIIIHVSPDSYCPDGVVAGCAGGARAACGVIVLDE
jgi:hypothetical protein